jgi:hypothetical protein
MLTVSRTTPSAGEASLAGAGLAGKEDNPRATKLRHVAQIAPFAACEAEQLLSQVTAEPPLTAEPLRHGPLGYVMSIGPVSLAGQRSRSGPYAGRRASRLP